MSIVTEKFALRDNDHYNQRQIISYSNSEVIDHKHDLVTNMQHNNIGESKTNNIIVPMHIKLLPQFKTVTNNDNVIFQSHDNMKFIINQRLSTKFLERDNKYGYPIITSMSTNINSIQQKEVFISNNKKSSIPSFEKLTTIYEGSDNDNANLTVSHDISSKKIIVTTSDQSDEINYKDDDNIEYMYGFCIEFTINDIVTLTFINIFKFTFKVVNDNVLIKNLIIRPQRVKLTHTIQLDSKKNSEFDNLIENTIPIDIAITQLKTLKKNVSEDVFNSYFIKIFKKYTEKIELYKYALKTKNKQLVSVLHNDIFTNEYDIETKCMIFWYTLESKHHQLNNNALISASIFKNKEVFEYNIPVDRLPTVIIEYKFSFVHNIINHKNTSEYLRHILITSITPFNDLKIIINSGLSNFNSTILKCLKRITSQDGYEQQYSGGLLNAIFGDQ